MTCYRIFKKTTCDEKKVETADFERKIANLTKDDDRENLLEDQRKMENEMRLYLKNK